MLAITLGCYHLLAEDNNGHTQENKVLADTQLVKKNDEQEITPPHPKKNTNPTYVKSEFKDRSRPIKNKLPSTKESIASESSINSLEINKQTTGGKIPTPDELYLLQSQRKRNSTLYYENEVPPVAAELEVISTTLNELELTDNNTSEDNTQYFYTEPLLDSPSQTNDHSIIVEVPASENFMPVMSFELEQAEKNYISNTAISSEIIEDVLHDDPEFFETGN